MAIHTSGRPPSAGLRYPCGKLRPKPFAAIETALNVARREAETRSVVLAQPHRKGSIDQSRVDAISRFIRRRKFRPEVTAAVDRYRSTRISWLIAVGAPTHERNDPLEGVRLGSGQGPSRSTVHAWRRSIEAAEKAAWQASLEGWALLRRLLGGVDIDPAFDLYASRSIVALAVAMGNLTQRDHPFA
jgi:hypothetical protein